MSAPQQPRNLIAEGNIRLQQALADHLDLVEQARADEAEISQLLSILDVARARALRWQALLRFNQGLNQLRRAHSSEDASSDDLPGKAQLMRWAVDAGLSLDRAAQLIATVRKESSSELRRKT